MGKMITYSSFNCGPLRFGPAADTVIENVLYYDESADNGEAKASQCEAKASQCEAKSTPRLAITRPMSRHSNKMAATDDTKGAQ